MSTVMVSFSSPTMHPQVTAEIGVKSVNVSSSVSFLLETRARRGIQCRSPVAAEFRPRYLVCLCRRTATMTRLSIFKRRKVARALVLSVASYVRREDTGVHAPRTHSSISRWRLCPSRRSNSGLGKLARTGTTRRRSAAMPKR